MIMMRFYCDFFPEIGQQYTAIFTLLYDYKYKKKLQFIYTI